MFSSVVLCQQCMLASAGKFVSGPYSKLSGCQRQVACKPSIQHGKRLAVCLVLLCVQSSVWKQVSAQPQPTQGYATIYGGPQDNQDPNQPSFGLLNGACGYGELQQSEWPYWNAVGLGPKNPIASKGSPLNGCGTCINVTCSDQKCAANASSVIVLVTDTCASCGAAQLNLHYLTFQNHLASPFIGQIGITFQQVDCNPPGKIVVKVAEVQADSGYLRLTLMSVAGSAVISSVGIRSSGSTSFTSMTNKFGAAWQAAGFGTQAPFDVQFTDSDGATYTAWSVISQYAEGEYATSIQIGQSSPTGNTSVPATAPRSNSINASPTATAPATSAPSSVMGPSSAIQNPASLPPTLAPSDLPLNVAGSMEPGVPTPALEPEGAGGVSSASGTSSVAAAPGNASLALNSGALNLTQPGIDGTVESIINPSVSLNSAASAG